MSPIQIGLPDHPDDLRRKVDEEIAELEVRLIARKSYRNTLAPIARLHPEVLQGIFFLAHDSSEPSHKGKTTLLVTWICRDWRELAHQTANIWSHIDFTHREWIEAALSRTKAHELEFTLDCAKAKLAHLFPLCLGNLSRIRSLVITAGQHGPTNPEHGFPRPDFDNLSIWTNPAPSLERLHLEHVFVHGNCFSGVCPSLRSLHLKSCIIGWPALPIVPSITELSIMRPSDRASVGDIMKILQVIGPNLKSLEFWDAANDSQSGLGSSRYQFPELKSFWLRQSNPGAVGLFLSQVLLPPSLESLHISAHCSDWVTSNLVQAVIAARDRKKWPLDYLTVAYDRPFTIFGITEDWSEPDHDEDRGGDSDSSDGVGDGDVGGDEMSGDEVDDEVDDEDNGGEEEDRNESENCQPLH
ncbi:hypothetical protein BDN72DRAFT_590051 [Pluteus cervinus]|uniref:Uncharacterized protein n=1 Tax=Pluteus cervinus TaxID=181527 RepID=A0ACD3AWN3_9AGAR|nr:hypothetical protein BDN72DRAFT_590051 [Pluteus cervinus]